MVGNIYAVVGPAGAGKTKRLMELLTGEPFSEKKIYVSEKSIEKLAAIKKEARVSLMPYSDQVCDEIADIYEKEDIHYFYIDLPAKASNLLVELIGLVERLPINIFLSYRVESTVEIEERTEFERIEYEVVG